MNKIVIGGLISMLISGCYGQTAPEAARVTTITVCSSPLLPNKIGLWTGSLDHNATFLPEQEVSQGQTISFTSPTDESNFLLDFSTLDDYWNKVEKPTSYFTLGNAYYLHTGTTGTLRLTQQPCPSN